MWVGARDSAPLSLYLSLSIPLSPPPSLYLSLGGGSLDNVGGGEGLSDDVGDDIREEVVREGPAVV